MTAFFLMVFGFLLLRTPVSLAKSDGVRSEADLWLWYARQDSGRLAMLNALLVSGLLFLLGGTLMLFGGLIGELSKL